MEPPYSLASHGTDLILEMEQFYSWYASTEKDAVILSVMLNLLKQMLCLLKVSKAQGDFIAGHEKNGLLVLFCEMKEALHGGSLCHEELPASLQALYETLFKKNPHAALCWILINLQEKAYLEGIAEIEHLMDRITPSLSETRAKVICANVEKISKEPLRYNSLGSVLQDATQGWLT